MGGLRESTLIFTVGILFVSQFGLFSEYLIPQAESSGGAQIEFDNSNKMICSSNPCSLPLLVSPGSDRMIIIVSTEEGKINHIKSIDISGGTSQGILIGTQQIGSGSTKLNLEMWRIMESDISEGTNTITVHFTSSPSDAGVSLMVFSGVAQQSEEVKASNAITSNAQISTEITSITDGSLIISAVGHGESSLLYTSHGSGQVERQNFSLPSAGQAVTTEIKSLAGSDIQSHTLPSSANRQAQYVASFAPAGEIVDVFPPTTTAIPSGGIYTSAQLVTLSSDEPSVIHFAINDDVTTSSQTYTEPILISDTSTLKFFGMDLEGNTESVKTENYLIDNNTSNDVFGIRKIYPTIDNGNTWYMDMQNPLVDPRFEPGVITQNPDGSWKQQDTQTRMGVYSTNKTTYQNTPIQTFSRSELDSNGYMQLPSDWKNFEMTGYVKLNQGTSDEFTWQGRGGRHEDSNQGCEGSAYKGQLFFDGGNRFAKETYHVQYDFTSAASNTPPLMDKWVGFKFVAYNKPGLVFSQQAHLETWIDVENNNNWVKINSFDDDGWGSGATHCSPAFADNMPISWGGPIAIFRIDNSNDFDFKNLSVREIQPDTIPNTTAFPSGGTYYSPQLITLDADESAIIYYTLDGTIPTTSSTLYVNPISISNNTTLQFFAVDNTGNISNFL